MLRPMLVGSLVAATLIVVVPAAAVTEPARAPAPPTDDGFPLEDYLRNLLKGKHGHRERVRHDQLRAIAPVASAS